MLAMAAILMLAWLSTMIVGLADLRFTHYEDGSGRITYCLPWEICSD